MDFTLSEEHEMLRELSRKFAREELAPRAEEVDRTGKISRDVLNMAAEIGLLGLAFPEEWDGSGMGETGFCIAMEELARGCFSTAIVIGGHESIGAMAIYLSGNDDQKERYLRPMARGELLGAFALTEPQAGSDASALRTIAEDKGDHFLLNGQKTFITNGGLADVYSVFAVTKPDVGVKGISAFIVEAKLPGVTSGKLEHKMGIHGAPTTDLFFENVKVPKENLLGKLEGGFTVAMRTLDVGRLSVAATCLGLAKEALDMSITHAKQRVQFGSPIGDFQGIKWMLAEMASEIYSLESIVYRSAWMCDNSERFSRESAICKLNGSETLCRVVDHAVQIHGGMGYMADFPIERFYRDARITRIFEGTNEIQKLVISSSLLQNGAY